MKERKIDPLIVRLVQLKFDLWKKGFYKTMHIVDQATQAFGYEMVEKLREPHPDDKEGK